MTAREPWCDARRVHREARRLERALDPAIAETLRLSGLDVSEIRQRLNNLHERITLFQDALPGDEAEEMWGDDGRGGSRDL